MGTDDTFEARLESFVAGFSAADIDEETRVAARRLVRDQFGVQVGLSVLPWSESVREYARESGGTGPCTVLGAEFTTDAETAAFVNATYNHGFEYDDAHGPSDGHPGSAVVPAAVAVGEREGATLDEVLSAVVAGYEVYARIGAALSPDLISNAWHPAGVLAPFGAATAAAVLMDSDAETVRHALAVAASHASGTTEYSSTGGAVKRAHPGIGARGGLVALRLADHGLTGPRRYLTGNKGLFQAATPAVNVAPADFERSKFEIRGAWLKQYACCGCTHPYIECVERIDPNPGTVSRVECRLQPKSNSVVGLDNENLYRPTSIEEAQFNLPFELSLALAGYGNGFQTHRRLVDGDLAYDDPAILDVIDDIELVVDDQLGNRYPSKFVGSLSIEFADGRIAEDFVEDPTGTPANPASAEQLREKFDGLAVAVLGERTAADLWDAFEGLGDGPVTEVTRHAVPP
jgi:2-methylcitrate dehydratase PrpD